MLVLGGGACAGTGGAGVGGAGAGGAGASDAGASGAGYGEGSTGLCTPGVPRCQGLFGYQSCEQDGTWGEAHSCAGYSPNGTSSYCIDIPTGDGSSPAWGTCVDPACWYWLTRGFMPGNTPVGICMPDGSLNRCNAGGTLVNQACNGECTQVGTLDGRELGFCASTCVTGARECLGGGLYRECTDNHWAESVHACPDGKACNPLTAGALTDVRCGGTCQPGTSRCRADRSAVESCNASAQWELDRPCRLGLCVPAGAQAECQAECSVGQHLCAWDGALSERSCTDSGLWADEQPCADGSSCRLSGTRALGCVACVSASTGSGNAFGGDDSHCEGDSVARCGADDRWLTPEPCAAGSTCSELRRGTSFVAACSGN